MTFTTICVGIVITLGICLGTILFGMFLGWMNDDQEFGIFVAYIMTAMIAGVSVTINLIQGGIL